MTYRLELCAYDNKQARDLVIYRHSFIRLVHEETDENGNTTITHYLVSPGPTVNVAPGRDDSFYMDAFVYEGSSCVVDSNGVVISGDDYDTTKGVFYNQVHHVNYKDADDSVDLEEANYQTTTLSTGQDAVDTYNKMAFLGLCLQALDVDYDMIGPNCNTATAMFMDLNGIAYNSKFAELPVKEGRDYTDSILGISLELDTNKFIASEPFENYSNFTNKDETDYIKSLYEKLSSDQPELLLQFGSNPATQYEIINNPVLGDINPIRLKITCPNQQSGYTILADTKTGQRVFIKGSSGADDIYAGEGKDYIKGGSGKDTLYGGRGDDIYKYYLGDGVDDIVDEEGFCDEIKLYNLDITKLSGSYNKISYDEETIITASGIDKVSLNGKNINFNNYEQDGNTDAVFTDGSVKIDMEDYGAQALTYMNMPLARQGYLDQYLMPIYEQEHSQWQTSHAIWQGAYQAWVEGGCVGDAPTEPSEPQQPTLSDVPNDIKYHGTSGHDYFASGSDNDFIYGYNGEDELYGGGGNDYIDGGADNDWLYGNNGDDTIDGGSGHDTIDGGLGADILNGGAGDDIIHAGIGDIVDGGSGGDIIHGAKDATSVDGGLGEDTVIFNGTLTQDIASKWSGIEFLGGDMGDNNIDASALTLSIDIRGDEGNDTIIGSAGSNTIYGDGGDDTIYIGSGDEGYGGSGTDTAYLVGKTFLNVAELKSNVCF